MRIPNHFYTKNIINSLEAKDGFASCKIGHVFWETLALLDKFDKDFLNQDHYLEKHYNYIKNFEGSYNAFFDFSNISLGKYLFIILSIS